jgi:hypothetical protein
MSRLVKFKGRGNLRTTYRQYENQFHVIRTEKDVKGDTKISFTQ